MVLRTVKPSQDGETGSVRTVDRALEVLFALADMGAPAGLAEIARQTGLDKATAYRLLRALARRQLVRPTDQAGQYTLGYGVLRLSSAILGGADLRAVARPFMRRLRDATQETIALSVLVNDERVYVDQLQSPHELRWTVTIGESAPLYAGAAAKAILSFLPQDEQERILAQTTLVPLTPNTPRTPEELRRHIQETRTAGYSIARGERVSRGGIAIAAPIFDDTGRPIGALTVCVPSDRFGEAEMRRFCPELLEATRQISVHLGYRQPAPST